MIAIDFGFQRVEIVQGVVLERNRRDAGYPYSAVSRNRDDRARVQHRHVGAVKQFCKHFTNLETLEPKWCLLSNGGVDRSSLISRITNMRQTSFFPYQAMDLA